jgi:hypothetical protein
VAADLKASYDAVYRALTQREVSEEVFSADLAALNRIYAEALSANEDLEATKAKLPKLAAELREYRDVLVQVRTTLERVP